MPGCARTCPRLQLLLAPLLCSHVLGLHQLLVIGNGILGYPIGPTVYGARLGATILPLATSKSLQSGESGECTASEGMVQRFRRNGSNLGNLGNVASVVLVNAKTALSHFDSFIYNVYKVLFCQNLTHE